jgi:type I restriction-modification system DNA methylase subunit
MPTYYHNEILFSEIYLEDITRQAENSDVLASLKVLGEYREYADTHNLKVWKESYVHEVLSALGFFAQSKSDHLTNLFSMGSVGKENPLSLCYVILPEENLDSTTIGRNWAEKIIRGLRENNLQWGLLTNGRQWRIYHQDEPTPYETYLEIDLEAILKEKAKEAYQIFHKFMKAENFAVQEDGKCQFDRFKKESQDKIDYIEKELANALKQREEGGKGVLSDLCMGYVEELRHHKEGDLDNEGLRKKIYHGAMLYMFRLLFLFYADARGLLSDENHELLANVEAECRVRHDNNDSSNPTFPIWDSLEHIFVDIDQTYNGGLFSPQESEFTRFLSDTRIGDAYLANVIFNLTTYREKNGQEKPISYRDMSVRHLGTLYEGLLEHKLFIAAEDTEVKVTKGKIQFIPASKGGKLVLGHYIRAGEVYFAGDPSERKSSGSYFTPEDVVNYIVSNTVGEKLKEKKINFLAEQQPTQQAYLRALDEDERHTLTILLEENALSFVREKVLSISVLDPAMGSGHFLVNATNLVSNLVTETLNELDIKGNLESGTGYWRRWVVENCIYGVDINPLAVELAKLSLWILSMAKNQPLSFLKHHLKCGNSLVGARLDDIGNYPFSTAKKDARQLSLFERDPDFRLAVEEAISKSQLIASHGSTARYEVEEKKAWLDQIEQALSGYKAICNVHTGLFFSSDGIDENDYTLLVKNKNFQLAFRLQKEENFFHWELEFPMVLLTQKGFDCVIGNPPYVDVIGDIFTDYSFSTYKGRNLYNYFVEKGLRLLNDTNGNLGFIIPISIITSARMKSTRDFIREFRGTAKYVNIDSSANPGTLFDGLKLRLSITFIKLNNHERKMRIFSSDFTKFFNAERNLFIPLIKTSEIPEDLIIESIIPKVGSQIEVSILRKMLSVKCNYFTFQDKSKTSHNKLYYKGTGYNYMLAFKSIPFFEVNGQQVENSKTKELTLREDILIEGAILVFSSSLFYWYWTVYSNCFDFTNQDFERFPIDLPKLNNYKQTILELYDKVVTDLEKNGEMVTYNKANGPTRYFQYRARFTKPLFDNVDDLLGEIYGFTDEELNFVKTYDLRFRTDDR